MNGFEQQIKISTQGRKFVLTLVKGVSCHNPIEAVEAMNKLLKLTGEKTSLSGSVEVLGSTFEFMEVTTPEEMEVNKAVKNADHLYEALGVDAALTAKGTEAYRDVLFNGLDVDKAIAIISEENKNLWSNERQMVQNGYMQTAQKWAEKPDITPADAAHGVAYDIYCATHPFQHGVDTRQEYEKNYDETFASSIKERQMKAARDLFG